MTTNIARRVLDFWFGKADLSEIGVKRKEWFAVDAGFDAAVTAEFGAAYTAAIAGEHGRLVESATGCLALVILLDQFPRNMFRGTARAFEADAKARAIARIALEEGHDKAVAPVPRSFFYLPFEHSEDAADQALSVALFEALGDPEWLGHAVRHRDVVLRFGRFPHRNALLGRASTPAEKEFLRRPDAHFGGQTPRED